ncbi:hypothetical protein TCAL_06904 [Tigriopus californicus]|uniref:RNB domain-containing protein n=1 Tax=Tigriopus californicus TaxID=6832 RepID=A0A553PL92_TIGCA|nr:DIS3-like exonuclease 2 [Tigriopus californicus]TRY78429.1 hypothetical protein TCAL_06904 [Tigriopus californicus]|eukprot:TCALIF_06904-PA protein Name:"Similar to Dis3l2 DIS3-like exonuclease 2 (Mus musculus)" AED:0.06 eAED:0.06 QI:273/1/1/1/1/1/6/88/844
MEINPPDQAAPEKTARKNRRKRGKKPQGRGGEITSRIGPPPAGASSVQPPAKPGKSIGPGPKSPPSGAYPPHFALDVVQSLLERCPEDFISGTFRINAKSYKDAYVSHPDPQCPDIHVYDFLDRNRAMHQDQVVVQLKAQDQWNILHEKIQEYLDEGQPAEQGPEDLALMASALDLTGSGRGLRGPRGLPRSARTRPESGGGSHCAYEYPRATVMAHPLWKKFVQPTAKVVCITEAQHTRLAAGRLRKFPDGNPNFALFAPEDSRVPRLKIQRGDCPPEFFARPQDFEHMLFIGQMIRWDMGHTALGKIAKVIGSYDDIAARSIANLAEKGIDHSDFPESIPEHLPPLPFVIPESEIQNRRDLRPDCVFTIDPKTARDLDDALSVTDLSDDRFKIGVHIADVSHFVKEDDPIDVIARDRATSVYLIDRVIPMLPRVLCEDLCSLSPAEDRLTFSVEWIMNGNGDIQEEWFGRTVIRNCCKLAYEHAQGMLDHPDKDWTPEELPPVEFPWTYKDLSNRVNTLNQLALKLRSKRVANGSLRLDNLKLAFTLDKETALPVGYQLYEHRHSNKLIEEFMLLANMRVAQKLNDSFPNLAVLRCHPPPKEQPLMKAANLLNRCGVPMNVSSSKAIAASLEQAARERSPQEYLVITNNLTKPMELARYFCAGCENPDNFRHYALAVDLYTHFTSPIRRYPDVLVHRLLDYALTNRTPDWNEFTIQKWVNHCNTKKTSAKAASEFSSLMFLALFIKNCGPIQADAIVCDVGDFAFEVLIPSVAVVKRVYLDRLANCTIKVITPRKELAIQFPPHPPEFPDPHVQSIRFLSKVSVKLFFDGTPHDFQAVLERP